MSQFETFGLVPRSAESSENNELATSTELDRPVSLAGVMGPLSRKKKLVSVIFFTMMAAVVAVTVVAGDNYESEFKVLVKQRVDPMASADAPSGARAGNVTEEDINSEVALIRSRDLLASVVEVHHLDAPGTHPWSRLLEKLEGGPAVRTDKAIRRLASNLRVEAIKKSNVIEVGYSSNDPALSAQVLKTLANQYMARHVELHESRGAYDFFAQQANQFQAVLIKAEADLEQFSHAYSTAAPQVERDLMLQKMADLRVIQAQSASAADSAFERYKSLQSAITATPTRIQTQVKSADNAQLLGELKTTLLNLELKRTDLAMKYAADYPAVKEADAQIAQTKAAIENEIARPVTDNATDQNPTYQWLSGELAKVQVEMPALRAQARMAETNSSDTEKQVMKLSDASIIKQDLIRNVQTAEQNYSLYQQKRELARISDELDKRRISNVVMAEEPVPSAIPVRSRLATIAMGLMVCLIMSGGVGFAADYLDPTFRSWKEVEDYLNVPVLATVPTAKGGALQGQYRMPLEIEPGAGI